MLELLRTVRVLGWRHLLRLARAKRHGEQLIRGFFATPTIIALLNAGLFDELARERSVSVESFASQRGLDPDVLDALCDYLYSLKVLERQDGVVTIGPRGRHLLDVLPGAFYSAGAYASVFYNLEPLLKGEKRYGADVERDTALAARGSGESGKLFVFPVVRNLIRERGISSVLDLGCGDAAFLIGLCQANEGISGYGVDISAAAIADGLRNVEQTNLDGRIQLLAEDMFDLAPVAERFPDVQAATIFFVLHEFLQRGPERVLDFLTEFRRTFQGVPLIVCESVRHSPQELRKRPGPIMEFQLVHALSGQRTVTRREWRDMFATAGFASVEEIYFGLGRMVIYTVR